MVRRLMFACAALAAVARGASANGRAPSTQSITFRQGQDSDIAVGLTFGLVVSHDSGRTWAWMCEDAIGYKGTYDPRYAFSSSGALFASTFNGLRVMRDSCTFNVMPSGSTFVSANTLGPGPDHAFYFAASQEPDPGRGIPGDFHIYKSIDDGMTFPIQVQPPGEINWWQSLEVAPSDPQRLYLSGYRYIPVPGGVGKMKQVAIFRSDNAGADWIELPTSMFTVMPNSVIDIVGIARDDPDRVYARVKLDDNSLSDSIYRSTDKGATWKLINHKGTSIGAFLVRDNHDLIVGTQALGAEISHDDGDHWIPLVDPPHMNCLVESSAHEIWACTQNYGFNGVPSDDAGIMKTTDLVHWTKVMRYQDLTEAVPCAAGTIQQDSCATTWCQVCTQLECTPSPSYGCPALVDAPVDAPVPPRARAGCCETGAGSGGSPLALGLAVGTLLLRPRRRREPR